MGNLKEDTVVDYSRFIESKTGQLSPMELSIYILQTLYGDGEMGESIDQMSQPTRHEVQFKNILFDEQAKIVFENPLFKNLQQGEKLQNLILTLTALAGPRGEWLAENLLSLCAIAIAHGDGTLRFSPEDQLTLIAFAASMEMTKVINLLSRNNIAGKNDITAEYLDPSESLNYFNFCRQILNIVTMGAMDTSWRSVTQTIDQK